MRAMILRRMAAGLILALVCGGWAVGAQAQSATVVENVYLENGVRKVDTKLKVQTSDARTRVTYVKVTVANAGTLKSAKLRLRCDGDGGSGVTRVYQGSHTNWTAGTITASNAPQPLAQITQLNTNYVIGQDYDFDVSSLVNKDGTYTLIVTKDELGGDVAFSSTRGPVAPKVMIEVDNTPTAPICGANGCEEGETCSSCSQDCGVCPSDLIAINQFSVVPEAGASAAIISYDVSASSGWTLQEVQVWRAPDVGGVPGTWKHLLGNSVDLSASNLVNYADSTRDGIIPGWYWYKIVVLDKSGASLAADPIKINPADEPGTTTPICGQNGCEAGETCSSCPADCGVCSPVCGQNGCEAGETCSSCPQDCGVCPVSGVQINAFSVVPEAGASAAIISYDVSASSGSTLQEIQVWRAPDAGGVPGTWKHLLGNSVDLSASNLVNYADSTRDGVPDPGYYWYKIVVLDKSGASLAADPIKVNPADEPGTTTPICGQNGCEVGETCSSCPADCGVCPASPVCGQNGCESNLGETCYSCPQDCGVCPVSSVERLRPSANKRYLVKADGTPVFLLGEAAWTMPENCTREDVDYYLNNRKAKGFNYVQIVAARDLDSEPLSPTTARTMNPVNRYGYRPFQFNAAGKADISKPIVNTGDRNDYWDNLEYIIQKAESMGMYVGILPTWGKYYINASDVSMRLFTTNNAKTYGRFLGDRYKQYPHIIWIMGGDMLSPDQYLGDTGLAIYRALAEGLVQGMTGLAPAWDQYLAAWDQVLITLHYGGSAHTYFNNDAWLKLNMVCSGEDVLFSDVDAAYDNIPTRPFLIGESRYEGWVWDDKYFGPLIIRQQGYQAVLGGDLSGYAYGLAMSEKQANDQVFRFQDGWRDRLDKEGAKTLGHLTDLLNNHGIHWWRLVPDQTAIVSGEGSGLKRNVAARSLDGDQLLVYFPNVTTKDPVTINLRKITTHARAAATWYDARNGSTQTGGVFATDGNVVFLPPENMMDAVLILKGTTAALNVISATPQSEFKTIGGEVVMAAEDYSYKDGAGNLRGAWEPEQIIPGYLGARYMHSTLENPGDGSHLRFNPDSASLSYVIDFKETGRYYVHLLTYAEEHDANGFFATLDGKEVNYGGVNPATGLTAYFIYVEKTASWRWLTDGGGTEGRGLKVSFDITTPGKHTFTLYRRDTGSRVDHIWLTKNNSTTTAAPTAEPGPFVVK